MVLGSVSRCHRVRRIYPGCHLQEAESLQPTFLNVSRGGIDPLLRKENQEPQSQGFRQLWRMPAHGAPLTLLDEMASQDVGSRSGQSHFVLKACWPLKGAVATAWTPECFFSDWL